MAGSAFRFLGSPEGDNKEESNGGSGRSSDDEASGGSSADDDGDDSDGGDVPARSPKRRRYIGTYERQM